MLRTYLRAKVEKSHGVGRCISCPPVELDDWELDAGTVARYSIAMYIMFLDVTHQHDDKKWVPQSRSTKFSFAGLPPRTPPKWQLSLRQPRTHS